MSKRPLCSVCIANFNGEEYLADCIESVYAQKFNYPIEIIVHDDSSTDESVTLIKEKYPFVKLITSKVNVGFCVSNNRMVSEARGEYILLLNNDAVLFPDALEALYLGVRSHGDGIYGLPQYNAQTGVLIDLGSIFDPFLNPIPNLDRTRQDVGMIIGACFWLSKSLWLRLGGFPEWFDTLAEDMYLSCLARLQGFPVKCLNTSGFNHWVGRNLGGGKVLPENKLATSLKRRSLSERNKTFVMVTTYPTLMAILLLPIHIFLLILEGGGLSIIKRRKEIWAGIYWNCIKSVWNRRKYLRDKREEVQSGRIVSLPAYLQTFTVIPHKIRMLCKYGIPHIKI